MTHTFFILTLEGLAKALVQFLENKTYPFTINQNNGFHFWRISPSPRPRWGANIVTQSVVVLVAVASIFVVMWMGNQVIKARKQYKVEYPAMYSPTSELFNCIQRAHQNTLGMHYIFLLLLFIGGLEMPVLSAVAGVIWTSGKVSYAKGYYTGDPKNRSRGSYALIGLFTLLIATLKFALRLITL